MSRDRGPERLTERPTDATRRSASRSQLPVPAAEVRLFVNRELSFLEFNQLIVEEARDPTVPLFERVKFVSIVSANLDEFFMIRVAGLQQQQDSGVVETGPDGLTPAEQLRQIRERVARQVAAQEQVLLDELVPRLRDAGVVLARVADLEDEARGAIEERFRREIFPMLTPLAVDPGHPFPLIKNRSLNLAIHLLPERSLGEATPLTALVQVPPLLPRFLEIPTTESSPHAGAYRVVLIEDVIRTHVGSLFPQMWILECVPFRVLRNWDLSFDEDEQEDLMEAVEKELRRRARLQAVRLEISEAASAELTAELTDALSLTGQAVERHRAPLALVDLEALVRDAALRVPEPLLRDEAYAPVVPEELREAEDLFAEIAERDVLLHHPYESYAPVVDLLAQAARDPSVLAIKQTLYRTNRGSPIVRSLIDAAERGKQVTALVELKARFDEETNVAWARALEEAGVHVVYGMVGLKTHCKVTLVVRREPTGLRRYVHIGTGNYNEKTASIYSDLSLFTARDDVTTDVAALFNVLTGYASPPAWQKLVVAPMDLRRVILERIDAARQAAKRGEPARIVIKTNALVDQEVIRALVRASQAGVDVVLLVRGPCGLRVGIPGVSDRIVVRTLVDRFLEHSRVLLFQHGGVEDVFLTSTDIMPRNFDRRVEVMVPIEDPGLKRRIVDEILATELADDRKAAVLEPSGAYRRLGGRGVRAQAALMDRARRRAGAEVQERRPKGGGGRGKAKKAEKG
jgi:polyphosphate kinase